MNEVESKLPMEYIDRDVEHLPRDYSPSATLLLLLLLLLKSEKREIILNKTYFHVFLVNDLIVSNVMITFDK